MCLSTNKSLVVTFWQQRSADKWVSQNILTAFPLHSFDHIVFIHDNSSWHTHPGHPHFMWIHVNGQLRFWYVKRFISPSHMRAYRYLWIIDDDAQLTFNPLHYQCVVQNLSIPLSAPGRLTGVYSHNLTQMNTYFINQIGRWTDFVETGPIVVASSLAWQCIHTFLDASAGSGWGIDLIWCNMIAERCSPLFDARQVCAILDAFGVHHQSAQLRSISDGEVELPIYTQIYKKWLTEQRIIGPLAKDDKLIRLCSQ